jgi:pimeloyl-ACP methyl ester carboxylesterase
MTTTTPTATGWASGDLTTNGIRTHYVRTGGEHPVLLLLHGATDNGLCWTPIARQLSDQYDVILPDARGHGQSAAPSDGYVSQERARDTADLIRGLHPGGPVAVGGHSMGAGTSYRLACDFPELVSCVVLEDPPFWQLGEDGRPAFLTSSPGRRNDLREQVARYQQLTHEQVMDAGRQAHPGWPEDELPAWADAKQQVSQAFLTSMQSIFNEPPWTDSLSRLACPMLLVTADPEAGAIVTPEIAEQARAANPNVQVVRIPGAGHNIRREQRTAFMQAVRDFLAAHVASGSRA